MWGSAGLATSVEHWGTGMVGALVVVVAHANPDVGGGHLDVTALGAGGSDRCHLVRMPSGCSGGAGVLGVICPRERSP